jgi:hypothetical protein
VIVKILKVIGILFLVSLGVGLIVLQFYTYDPDKPRNKTELLQQLNPLATELIIWFDETNLDDPATCKEELEQIGFNLSLGIAGEIESIQYIPFHHLWSESAKQLEELKRQARSAGFSFSFASANACEQKGFFKLDKLKLRQSLVELEESVKGFN